MTVSNYTDLFNNAMSALGTKLATATGLQVVTDPRNLRPPCVFIRDGDQMLFFSGGTQSDAQNKYVWDDQLRYADGFSPLYRHGLRVTYLAMVSVTGTNFESFFDGVNVFIGSGHSWGGNMAQLAGILLRQSQAKPDANTICRTYSHGSPRGGGVQWNIGLAQSSHTAFYLRDDWVAGHPQWRPGESPRSVILFLPSGTVPSWSRFRPPPNGWYMDDRNGTFTRAFADFIPNGSFDVHLRVKLSGSELNLEMPNHYLEAYQRFWDGQQVTVPAYTGADAFQQVRSRENYPRPTAAQVATMTSEASEAARTDLQSVTSVIRPQLLGLPSAKRKFMSKRIGRVWFVVTADTQQVWDYVGTKRQTRKAVRALNKKNLL